MSRPTSRLVRLIAWPVCGLAALALALVWTHPSWRAGAKATTLVGVDAGTPLHGVPAPDLTLTDQFGKTLQLSSVRGQAVVMAFIDSRCTTTCPLTAQMLHDAQTLLGPAASDVRWLAVNANPNATEVSDVLAWSQSHGMTNNWQFLTGPAATLSGIWSAYHVSVEVEANGDVTHTDAVYVLDPQGKEQYVFTTDPDFAGTVPEAADLAQRIASVLPGHVHLAPTRVLTGKAVLPGTIPAAGPFTLPLLASGAGPAGTVSVAQGPVAGQPRLVAFFASWCQACKTDMQALKTYQAATGTTAGPPPVVAVDIAVAEPSTAFVQSFVGGLGLTFPVGMDTDGSIASAYGVTDLPYLALVNGTGQVIWRHVGALSAGDLLAQVHGALAKAA